MPSATRQSRMTTAHFGPLQNTHVMRLSRIWAMPRCAEWSGRESWSATAACWEFCCWGVWNLEKRSEGIGAESVIE